MQICNVKCEALTPNALTPNAPNAVWMTGQLIGQNIYSTVITFSED